MSEISKPNASRRQVLRNMGALAGAVAMPSIVRAQAPIIMKMGTDKLGQKPEKASPEGGGDIMQ